MAPAFWMPDPDECEEEPYSFDLGDADRVVVRLVTHVTRIVEFAMTQQTRGQDGGWKDVVRADSAHGTVHIHRFNQSGIEFTCTVLQRLESVADVDAGYVKAEEIIFEGWQENLRRWRSGR